MISRQRLRRSAPKTVSCADILTAATRDATVQVGGPYWAVPYGRKDGKISIAKETEKVPMGHEDLTSLLEIFQSQGLNVLDLVILSGEPCSPHAFQSHYIFSFNISIYMLCCHVVYPNLTIIKHESNLITNLFNRHVCHFEQHIKT